MAGGVDPVEDYGNVREEFADNIERTCTSNVSNLYNVCDKCNAHPRQYKV